MAERIEVQINRNVGGDEPTAYRIQRSFNDGTFTDIEASIAATAGNLTYLDSGQNDGNGVDGGLPDGKYEYRAYGIDADGEGAVSGPSTPTEINVVASAPDLFPQDNAASVATPTNSIGTIVEPGGTNLVTMDVELNGAYDGGMALRGTVSATASNNFQRFETPGVVVEDAATYRVTFVTGDFPQGTDQHTLAWQGVVTSPDQSLSANTNYSFDVVASGTLLTVRWYINNGTLGIGDVLTIQRCKIVKL